MPRYENLTDTTHYFKIERRNGNMYFQTEEGVRAVIERYKLPRVYVEAWRDEIGLVREETHHF